MCKDIPAGGLYWGVKDFDGSMPYNPLKAAPSTKIRLGADFQLETDGFD